MEAEHRIVEPGPLHDVNGALTECGYATSELLRYDRRRVRAPRLRIKEWDYYLINDDEYAVCLTLSDLGYMGLISASVVNLVHPDSATTSVMVPLPFGRIKLSQTSDEGVSSFSNGRAEVRFETHKGRRLLFFSVDDFADGDTFTCEVVLDRQPRDSMMIATPWAEDKKAFYYNRKIMAMRATGSFRVGPRVHGFDPARSFGLLDWGRGVWTFDNTWYWAAAQGWQDGHGSDTPGSHRVGFNLGYGFGDTSAASENMFFLDGQAIKFGHVDFGIPEKPAGASAELIADRYELMQPWHITDGDDRLDLTFTPLHDRIDYISVGPITSDQHQVFGRLDGAVLVDGQAFFISGLQGSAEVIHNRY